AVVVEPGDRHLGFERPDGRFVLGDAGLELGDPRLPRLPFLLAPARFGLFALARLVVGLRLAGLRLHGALIPLLGRPGSRLLAPGPRPLTPGLRPPAPGP